MSGTTLGMPETPRDADRLLSLAEVREALGGLSESTVARLIGRGELVGSTALAIEPEHARAEVRDRLGRQPPACPNGAEWSDSSDTEIVATGRNRMDKRLPSRFTRERSLVRNQPRLVKVSPLSL